VGRAKGEASQTIKAHAGWVGGVAVQPDGRWVATSRQDKRPPLGRPDRREALHLRGHKNEVWTVAFSPDGQDRRPAPAKDTRFCLWDAATGEEVRSLTGHTGEVYTLAFRPDNGTCQLRFDGTIRPVGPG